MDWKGFIRQYIQGGTASGRKRPLFAFRTEKGLYMKLRKHSVLGLTRWNTDKDVDHIVEHESMTEGRNHGMIKEWSELKVYS